MLVQDRFSEMCSSSVIFLLTIMFQCSSSRTFHKWIVIFIVLVPAVFFLIFGMMEDRVLSRGIKFSLPTPLSEISLPLYPNQVPLIDLKHFKYVINNDICDQKDIFIVILIHTHPANREVRDVMRRNIPKEDLMDIGIRRIFLMAKAEWDDQKLYQKTPQSDINEENALHSDIVQGNFKEHYHNLTYKHVMGLQWVTKYCNKIKHVIKMDDDIVVDLFQFRDLLKYRYSERNNLILGLLQIEAKPIRQEKSKWYVSKKEFSGDVYANFVSGWAYSMSMDAVMKIVDIANRSPYFWIDDVHITGTLAERIGVKREGLNRFYTVHKDFLRCCIEMPNYKEYFCDFYVGPDEGSPDLMEKLLVHARNCYIQSCIRRPLELRLSKTCVTSALNPLAPAGKGYGEVIKI